MSGPVTFVTSNDIKFTHATAVLEPFGVVLDRGNLDFQELQSADGKAIASHKAQQAFNSYKQPVIVTDDTWIIPGLKGFPGAYMAAVNEWFTSEDWVRLTASLQDRSIVLRQHIVFQDGDQQQYFSRDRAGILLREARGQHSYGHLSVISFSDDTESAAERITAGKLAFDSPEQTVWHDVGLWLSKRP